VRFHCLSQNSLVFTQKEIFLNRRLHQAVFDQLLGMTSASQCLNRGRHYFNKTLNVYNFSLAAAKTKDRYIVFLKEILILIVMIEELVLFDAMDLGFGHSNCILGFVSSPEMELQILFCVLLLFLLSFSFVYSIFFLQHM